MKIKYLIIGSIFLFAPSLRGFAESRGRVEIRRNSETNSDRSRPPAEEQRNRSETSRREENSVIIRMRHQNIPRQQNFERPTHIERSRPDINYPSHIGRSGKISQQISRTPPAQHTTIIRNPGVMRKIQSSERVEIIPNKYYWHRESGVRYCHYYDHGTHWYGFYNGPTFYWTHFYNGYWWWFDINFDRWVYLHDGNWYWTGPSGNTYVYVDNTYYPYDDDKGIVTVKTPEVTAPPTNIPSGTSEGSTWKNSNGTRMIQIYGDHAEAFLYDSSFTQPVFLKYLGKDVDRVRFSTGTTNKSSRILIDFKDGSFALTSEDGNPIDEVPDLKTEKNAPPTSPGTTNFPSPPNTK